MVTLTSLYWWGSGNHENDQVADHLDHAQRVSGEQLQVIKRMSYGSLILPSLWFYGRLLPNHFWWRTWPSSNDHPNVTKIGAQMITLTSPIWPGAFQSVVPMTLRCNFTCHIDLTLNLTTNPEWAIWVVGTNAEIRVELHCPGCPWRKRCQWRLTVYSLK